MQVNEIVHVHRFHARLEQYSCALHKSQKQNQIFQKEREGDAAARAELQQKYSEKSRSVLNLTINELPGWVHDLHCFFRQKRKLEEMYEALRGEYESLKQNQRSQQRNSRPAIMPSSHSFDVVGVRGSCIPCAIVVLVGDVGGRLRAKYISFCCIRFASTKQNRRPQSCSKYGEHSCWPALRTEYDSFYVWHSPTN